MNHIKFSTTISTQKINKSNKITRIILSTFLSFVFSTTVIHSVGTPGNIDTGFAVNGYLSLTGIGSATALPVVVLPVSDGDQYVAWNDPGVLVSYVTRFTNVNILDSSYGPALNGYSANCFPGVTAMIMDGDGNIVFVGVNDVTGNPWISRFLSDGTLDPDFGTAGATSFGPNGSLITTLIQQTPARYIVAGFNWDAFQGALWAFTDSGEIDTTFNSTSLIPGGYIFSGASCIYGFVTDEYDRIIVAYMNNANEIDIARLTPSGELDTTFGVSGIISSAIVGVTDVTQTRVAFDASGNIVLAARTSSGIQIIAYANTTGTHVVEIAYTITSLTTPVVTNVIATADGKVLLSGNQSGSNDMWVARIQNNGSGNYELDTTFNPTGSTYGTIRGIMQFYFDVSATARNVASIAIYPGGTISILGTETDTTVNPFMSRAYDNPGTTQTLACLNSKPAGTSDQTFGVTTNVGNGIAFYGSNSSGAYDANLSQRAKVVAMQDDNNIVVALDGSVVASGPNVILLNVFDVDGLLNPNFNTNEISDTNPYNHGQALVLSMFNDQYVNDMLTFTTADGINKAILAGLAYNQTLNKNGSLVIQYNLTDAILDPTFGGLNGNSLGVAFGDGQQANVLGLQSNGRIIVGGIDQSDNGLLLGYNTVGNLDQGFGQGGMFVLGTTGIFAQAIDDQDRIVIAYNDGSNNVAVARILSDGSDLDDSFGVNGITAVGLRISGLSGDSNIRLVLDQDQNIILTAVITNGTAIALNVWNPNGTAITASLTVDNSSPYFLDVTSFTLSKLLIDANGKTIIVGFDYDGTGQGIVIRTGANVLTPDTTFNADTTPGYLRFIIGSDNNLGVWSAIVHPDGRIIIHGSQIQ